VVNRALRRGDCAVEVWWLCDATHAELEVTTDLTGIDLDGDAPAGPWVETLRHHAAGIGATLVTDPLADGVSRMRCSLSRS
jgi:hypothetical protein